MLATMRTRIAALLPLLAVTCFAGDRPAGTVDGARRDTDERRARQEATAARLAAQREGTAAPKQILFGDLHVHTTYSLDAFTLELPMMGLQGVHTPADACDFARHCAGLDFFSLNDHAESLTPEHWSETKRVLRECAASAGEPSEPDLIALAGWEWTQIGNTPEAHWGHKNVIFPQLGENQLPVRPISSLAHGGGLGVLASTRQATSARFVDPLHWKPYADLAWLLDRVEEVPRCPRDVPVRELPPDCHENAPSPAELYAKLDDWGFETLVIPHGNAWGMYTPPTASWDKALDARQHDSGKQRLLEIMSGHGNSEEYRDFRPVLESVEGRLVCPAPSADFLPCCWQAGEIMRERCGDMPEAECEARVLHARELAAEAGANPRGVFPDAPTEAWLDCDQCRDCFKPAFNYRPTESSQYAMAISNFDETGDDGRPLRFRFGFLASTDDHTARPGTGYKQYARRQMTFASGPVSERFFPIPVMDDPQTPRAVDPESVVVPDGERVASFAFPGGIVAAHAEGRSREALWAALERREVYGTSGPRMLLWFDLMNAPGGPAPMGSEVELDRAPHFEVRAAGAFRQAEGCPDEVQAALAPERIEYLCGGECLHPGSTRHPITAIEVVRIRPQVRPGEAVGPLVEDPWRRFECPPDSDGCSVRFRDEDFESAGRDAVYYVRALQEQTSAINADTLRTRFDDAGRAVSVEPCHGDFRTPFDDDCLAPIEERAWSSPIFVNAAARSARRD